MAAIVLTLTLTGPAAYAHTDDQLDAWTADWAWSVWARGGITHQLFMQRWDMANRHPCYFREQCPPHVHTTAPTPRAVSARPPVGSYAGVVERWRPLVARYFPGEVDTAMCVLRWESSGNPNARNPGSSAAGLWQFLRDTWNRAARANGGPTYDQGGPFDPELATRYAAWLRNRPDSTGWGQWTAYRSRCR